VVKQTNYKILLTMSILAVCGAVMGVISCLVYTVLIFVVVVIVLVSYFDPDLVTMVTAIRYSSSWKEVLFALTKRPESGALACCKYEPEKAHVRSARSPGVPVPVVDFYEEYHGHQPCHLSRVYNLLKTKAGSRRFIFLAGDSSLDNKHW
jgi:hypothetical protein